ncbi:restriction endonuclease [Ancylomarina longa]|uniref:Restriction endonuclease n=1 Tax=Ancylomarina longa TaxID=2487017 RepID=A0A434AWN7_9BACT|nr:restriction endonuclease [Ancylomarina longa]RUT78950.1 restriction endonuclease [Ancylomarina longa]
MAVPDYQSLMLPLLQATTDNRIFRYRDLIDILAKQFQLTAEERKELLPSGSQPLFDNRVGWANTYLKKAGLLQSEKRGYVQITALGHEILASKPEMINNAFLRRFESFNQFTGNTPNGKTDNQELVEETIQTPEEQLEGAWTKLNRTLSGDILDKVKQMDPYKFEQLVVDLLLAMGYGGSRQEAGRTVGKSGDGGIDGIINEDRLGLDKIYLQAKRWENTVPIKEIRDFAGALLAQKARKGVFITTSEFSKSAFEFVDNIDRTIVLIDGHRLAEFMIEHSVGVSTKRKFVLKEMDGDYFEN